MRPAGCRRLLARGAALIMGAAPCVLAAQDGARNGLSATLDVGASRIHYDGYLPSGVVDLAPSIRLDASDAVLVARGSVARFESGNVNTHGTIAAGVFTDPWGPLRGELFVGGTLGHHESVGSTGRLQLGGRAHLGGEGLGAWAGASGGWSALGGDTGSGVTDLEAGGWLREPVGRGGWLRATASVHVVRVQDITYSDLAAALRWASDRAELGLDVGIRTGDRIVPAATEGRAWLAGDAAVWLHPSVALVASAGRFLTDPTTSAVGGRFVSAGLRLALRRPPRDELPRVVIPRTFRGSGISGNADAALAAEELTVEEGRGGQVTLRLRLPGARSASVMGDFTAWEPVPLTRGEDGSWHITVALEPGVHRVNLRTDDGEWRAPPGLTAVDDGFGGEVGLLVVRR